MEENQPFLDKNETPEEDNFDDIIEELDLD